MTVIAAEPVGNLLRLWRERRRRSQLDVSIAAELSARHLSFLETGRSSPSRSMIERLCEELEIPLRERNTIYLAAGYAPVHREQPLANLGVAREVIETILAGHEPNPSLAVNVNWELMAANRAMEAFFDGIDEDLLTPPVNVLRVTLHPRGLAPRIVNLRQWRDHTLRRVRRQLDRTASPQLTELHAELASYPVPGTDHTTDGPANDYVMPMRMRTHLGELSLLYATTVFGSPRDVTLDEIAIETFFPADAATARALRTLPD